MCKLLNLFAAINSSLKVVLGVRQTAGQRRESAETMEIEPREGLEDAGHVVMRKSDDTTHAKIKIHIIYFFKSMPT